MAINWNFNADNYKENDFAPLKPGEYRVRIAEAVETTSSKGNDMIKLTLDVSGHGSKLWDYIVFMPDNPQMTDRKLGQIWSSFDIAQGDLNLDNWKGKVGAVRVKHEMYQGEAQARISYYLTKAKQEALPAWEEAPGKASVTGGGASSFAPVVNEGDLPF